MTPIAMSQFMARFLLLFAKRGMMITLKKCSDIAYPELALYLIEVFAKPQASLLKDDLSSLILTPGQLDSIISEVEASINVPDYGTFNLHIKQLDLGFKPTHGISKYVNPKSNLSVTLKQNKPLPGSKPKYEIVRAHVNEDKKSFEVSDGNRIFGNLKLPYEL